jgi:SAM-dependent methyltransferase
MTSKPNERWAGEPGPTIREEIPMEGRTFVIDRPAHPERLVDPTAADSPPYWSELWPAAILLARVILREPWPPGAAALEIGCGLGLPGNAALAAGLKVTFSDRDPVALGFAAANARSNGFDDFQTVRLDWDAPPAGLQVPVLLGSDLVYEMRDVAPLVHLIQRILAPGGVCLLTNLDRVPSQALGEALGASGLSVATQTVRGGDPARGRFKGTLYRIRN